MEGGEKYMKSKTNTQKKGGMSVMTVGTAGAIIGGAIGAGAAIALSNPSRRKAVGHKIEELKTYATDAISEMRSGAEDLQATPRKLRRAVASARKRGTPHLKN